MDPNKIIILAIIATSVATFISRFLGALTSERVDASSKLFDWFNEFEIESRKALDADLVFPAYDYVLKCSHVFNQLDAANAISVSARASYIARVRTLAQDVAKQFLEERRKLEFPLMKDRVAAQTWIESLSSGESSTS